MVLPKIPEAPKQKVFEEVFYNREGSTATVTIVVDFTTPITDSYLKAHVKSSDPAMDGAKTKCDDHRKIKDQYPISKLHSWVSDQGVTLLQWLCDLCDRGHLIPTQKEINGGKTNHDLERERNQRDMKLLAANRHK